MSRRGGRRSGRRLDRADAARAAASATAAAAAAAAAKRRLKIGGAGRRATRRRRRSGRDSRRAKSSLKRLATIVNSLLALQVDRRDEARKRSATTLTFSICLFNAPFSFMSCSNRRRSAREIVERVFAELNIAFSLAAGVR